MGSASSQPFLLGVNSGQGNRLCWFFVLALFSGAGTMHGISLRTLHTLRHFTLNTAQFVGHARQFTLDTTQLVAMHLGHCKICGPCMAIHLGHCTACGTTHGSAPWTLHTLWQFTLGTAQLAATCMAIHFGHCIACGDVSLGSMRVQVFFLARESSPATNNACHLGGHIACRDVFLLGGGGGGQRQR